MRAGPAQSRRRAAAFPAEPFGSVRRPVHSECGPAPRFAPEQAEPAQAVEQPGCPGPLGQVGKHRASLPAVQALPDAALAAAFRYVPVAQPAPRRGPRPAGHPWPEGAADPVPVFLVALLAAVLANLVAPNALVRRQQVRALAGAAGLGVR